MCEHLLMEMIEELESYRSSMNYTAIFGHGHEKLDQTKNLERIINQAKQELAVIKGISQ